MTFDQDDEISQAIRDSVQDIEEGAGDTPEPVEASAAPEPTEPATEAPEAPEEQSEDKPVDTAPAGAKTKETQPKAEEDFSEKYGILKETSLGRENRIPYSRVQKIVAKAAAEAETLTAKKFEGWAPAEKVKEYETQINTYKAEMDAFEKGLANPEQTLAVLEQIPAYQPFFQTVRQMWAQLNGQAEQPANDDPKPLPGEDGIYTDEGLTKLLEWNGRQVEKRINTSWEDRYNKVLTPLQQREEALRKQEESARYLASLEPKINAQIEEAYKWTGFKDNEAEIVKAMAANPQMSHQEAYIQVVVPKLIADQNKIRENVIRDMKSAPKTTAAPVAHTKTVQPVADKSIEDIIREASGIK